MQRSAFRGVRYIIKQSISFSLHSYPKCHAFPSQSGNLRDYPLIVTISDYLLKIGTDYGLSKPHNRLAMRLTVFK